MESFDYHRWILTYIYRAYVGIECHQSVLLCHRSVLLCHQSVLLCHQSVLLINLVFVSSFDDNNADGIKCSVFKFHEVTDDYEHIWNER